MQFLIAILLDLNLFEVPDFSLSGSLFIYTSSTNYVTDCCGNVEFDLKLM